MKILSQSNYVGADYDVIANSMTGTFEYEKGDKRAVPDFNVFFRYNATYPYYSDAVWYLSQMRRWGQIAEAKDDSWYDEVAKSVYRPDIYATAGEGADRRRQDERRRVPRLRQRAAIAHRRPSSSTGDLRRYQAERLSPKSFEIGLKGSEKPWAVRGGRRFGTPGRRTIDNGVRP